MSVIVCFKKIEKIDPDPSVVPASYFSHFESVFSDFKSDECAH
jgi:hypothetical protein